MHASAYPDPRGHPHAKAGNRLSHRNRFNLTAFIPFAELLEPTDFPCRTRFRAFCLRSGRHTVRNNDISLRSGRHTVRKNDIMLCFRYQSNSLKGTFRGYACPYCHRESEGHPVVLPVSPRRNADPAPEQAGKVEFIRESEIGRYHANRVSRCL
jgi:hypothetical protein